MSAPDLPDQFFTLATFGSVAGCATFSWVIVNGIRVFTGFSPKWLVLLVSAIVVGVVFVTSKQPVDAMSLLLLVGNIIVVALTALGLQEGTSRGVQPTKRGEEFAATRPGWFSSWLD